jgi:hypothetical protein
VKDVKVEEPRDLKLSGVRLQEVARLVLQRNTQTYSSYLAEKLVKRNNLKRKPARVFF